MNRRAKLSIKSTSLIAWLSLIVALLGGVPGIISIKNDIFRFKIEVNIGEALLTPLISINKDRFSKNVLCFRSMRLVGDGEKATSVRDIRFFIDIKDKWVEGKRIDIRLNKLGIMKTPGLILGSTNDTLCIADWIGFKGFLGEYYIEPGKTVPIDIVFMFDLPEKEILNADCWKVVVYDHHGEKYITKFKRSQISTKLSNLYDKSMVLFDCPLENTSDVQRFLQLYKHPTYSNLQSFLRSKKEHKN